MSAEPASNELIRFDGVTKRFGDKVVLDQLDFTVSTGKHVTLIGPSGSGKTTILRLLMTLERADAGTIVVDGDHLTHERKRGTLGRHRGIAEYTKAGFVAGNVVEQQCRLMGGTGRDLSHRADFVFGLCPVDTTQCAEAVNLFDEFTQIPITHTTLLV